MTKQILIQRFKEIGVIYRERVTLRSGEVSDFYCDVKKSFGYPDVLNALADEIGKLLPTETTCIAVSGYGGLPLGAVVASRFGKKFTAVRGSEKNHGKGGMIDSYIPTESDIVVIIDDVLTSGSSIKETLTALQSINAHVHSAIVAVNRGNPTLPISYQYVFTIDELTQE